MWGLDMKMSDYLGSFKICSGSYHLYEHFVLSFHSTNNLNLLNYQ